MKRPNPKTGFSVSVSAEGTSTPTKDIDAYLANLPEPAKTTLTNLRQLIRTLAPKATEAISYQLPAFRYHGNLVSYGATTKICALYLMSSTVLVPFMNELTTYNISKGTIHFPADAPLPEDLVKRIIEARIAQNESKAALKGKR